jgi:CRP-like cAMP-binding protein
MISEALLEKFGALRVSLKKKEMLFEIDTTPRFYYQVISGEIKMGNLNEDGKEYIQGLFSKGSSFGEPPLFGEMKYPAYAMAVEDSLVWQLEKSRFFELLKSNPDAHLKVTKTLAKRLHYKATMVAGISTENATDRLLNLMDYFKEHIHKIPGDKLYRVELSRQQLADLTGLRVETVIRAVKELENTGEVQIKSRKIYR